MVKERRADARAPPPWRRGCRRSRRTARSPPPAHGRRRSGRDSSVLRAVVDLDRHSGRAPRSGMTDQRRAARRCRRRARYEALDRTPHLGLREIRRPCRRGFSAFSKSTRPAKVSCTAWVCSWISFNMKCLYPPFSAWMGSQLRRWTGRSTAWPARSTISTPAGVRRREVAVLQEDDVLGVNDEWPPGRRPGTARPCPRPMVTSGGPWRAATISLPVVGAFWPSPSRRRRRRTSPRGSATALGATAARRSPSR